MLEQDDKKGEARQGGEDFGGGGRGVTTENRKNRQQIEQALYDRQQQLNAIIYQAIVGIARLT